MIIEKKQALKGEVNVPGDKSISHRAIMLGSIAEGRTEITNFLQGADCLSTIQSFQQMGVKIENSNHRVCIEGKGLRGLKAPNDILNIGNSGTTIRLISGILSAQNFTVAITGDDSIQKRPMGRIIEPLSMMGADIKSVHANNCAPLKITGRQLKGIHYTSPVASAQIKSSILLAGLYAEGITTVTEPYVSRNHTELMLKSFQGNVMCDPIHKKVSVTPTDSLVGQKIDIPGDISSAAYFIAAALLVPNSEILLKNVGINPTRDGILDVCKAMGADIAFISYNRKGEEESADILVRSSHLKGIVIEGALIPKLIDELPIIAVMACFAEGTTIIKDAAELKVKESNRIDVMAENLAKMGADIIPTDDGLIIQGGKKLKGGIIDSRMDHRIAMSFAVAGLAADGKTEIINSQCVDISYPEFYKTLFRLSN